MLLVKLIASSVVAGVPTLEAVLELLVVPGEITMSLLYLCYGVLIPILLFKLAISPNMSDLTSEVSYFSAL